MTSQIEQLDTLAESLADGAERTYYVPNGPFKGWHRVGDTGRGYMLAVGEAHPYKGTQSVHACEAAGVECPHVAAGPYKRLRRPSEGATGGLSPRLARMSRLQRERPLGLSRTPTATPLGWSEAMHAGDVTIWREGHMAYRMHGPEGGDRDKVAIADQFPGLYALMRGEQRRNGPTAEDRAKATAARAAAKAARKAEAAAIREALATGRTIVIRQGDARLVRQTGD